MHKTVFLLENSKKIIYSDPTTNPPATRLPALICQFSASINPFMPSVPKNGTPTLMVNHELIQALTG